MKKRLDIIVSEKLKISRSLAGNLITNAQISVNGNIVLHKDLEFDSNIKVQRKKEKIIDVLLENNDFAIVKKPYGISVCRTFNTPKFESVLNEQLKKIMPLSKAIKDFEFGLPHRLDKTTEGLMIISKTDDFYDFISYQFQNLSVQKKYLAVYDDRFFIKFPRDNILDEFVAFQCSHGLNCFSFIGKNCICEKHLFKVVKIPYREERNRVYVDLKSQKFMETYISLQDGFVECIPINGVRHQVRLTMEFLGLPIAGDTLYSSKITGPIGLFSVFIGFEYKNQRKNLKAA